METGFKILYTCSLFFCLSLFFVTPAKAEISQLMITSSQHVDHYLFQKLGTGYDDLIKDGYYEFYSEETNTSGVFNLVECPNSSYTTCTTKFTVTGSDQAINVRQTVHFTLANAVQLNPTKYYYFYITGDHSQNYFENFSGYGSDEDRATTKYDQKATCDTLWTECQNIDYVYFKLLSAEEIFFNTNAVYEDEPYNGQLDLPTTTEFYGYYDNNRFDSLKIDIYNRNLSTREILLDVEATVGSGIEYYKSIYLNPGNYSYIIYLEDRATGEKSLDYSSMPIFFTVQQLSGSSTPLTVPYFTSIDHIADPCSGVDTETITGQIECAFRNFIDWAITPNDTTIAEFQDNFGRIKNAFPFNAFFDLTTIISTSLSATTTTTDTIGIPFIDESGNYYILPVLSSSSLPNLIGGTNAILFRSTIGWIFWILVAFIIFLQFKII